MENEIKFKRNKKFVFRNKWYAYGMIAPGFILLTIFVIIPFVIALYRSFTDYHAYNNNVKFVYFEHYIRILRDGDFTSSLINVIILTLVYTVIMVLITFAFAHVVKKLSPRLAGATKILIYIPYLLSGILISVIFLSIFSDSGIINALRRENLKESISFEMDGLWPYFVIVLPMLWAGFGYNSLVMLAGLLNIPKDYYEAAEMDGANGWQKLTHITIPNMKNYFVLIIINLVTGGLQMFEIPWMMTKGNVVTPVSFIFHQSAHLPESARMAGAILIMIPIAFINIFIFKIIKSEKSMD